MQVVCPNASCGAVYTVSPQHIGKSFPCRACGTTVTVHGTATPAPAAAPAAAPVAAPLNPIPTADPAPAPAAPYTVPSQPRAMQQQLLSQVKGDLFTYLLGLGVIILGLFLFLTILGQAGVQRKQAKIDEGDIQQAKEDDYLARRERQANQNVPGVTAPSADEKKNRQKQKDAWQDARADLNFEMKESAASARAWRYWYTWGAFLGAMMVGIAALGYVTGGQTTTRRVVGAVILIFLLASFLGAMIGKGPTIAISP